MDELVKTLRHYIARDLVFLVSGGSVVATFLYVFRGSAEIHPNTWRTPVYLLAAGIAYVVGYVAQDVASIFRLVTTAPVQQPWRLMQSVYRWFKRTKWKQVSDIDTLYKRQAEWERESAKGNAPDYERTIMLMQVGTSGGPCAFVCAVLLLVKLSFLEHDARVDTALLVGAMVLGLSLVILGWLKAMQLTEFLRHGPPSGPH